MHAGRDRRAWDHTALTCSVWMKLWSKSGGNPDDFHPYVHDDVEKDNGITKVSFKRMIRMMDPGRKSGEKNGAG